MKQVFVSQAARRRCQFDLVALAKSEEPDIKLCTHNDYCYVRQIKGGNCLAGMKNCQVAKFYNRYGGEQGNYLGV